MSSCLTNATHSGSEPPTGARRRSPSPRPGVPPANPASPCVRGSKAPAIRAALAGRGRDRAPRWAETGRRGVTVRPGAGILARRRAVAPPDNPLRAPRGGGGDRGAPGSRAWSARRGPNGGCDGPGRTEAAAREAATFVAVVEHAPERGRNRPGTGADLFDPAIRSVPHHHPARVARQAPRRFRGNVRAVLEDRLPRTWTTTWYRSPGALGSIPW